MKRIIIGLLAIVLLSGCSASWHFRKARKLDSTLFTSDTVKVVDTLLIDVPVVSEKVLFDTLVQLVQVDPVTKIETVVKYRIQHDSIMIECPDKEVVTVVQTVVNTVEIKPSLMEKAQWFLYAIGVIVVVLGIRRLIG